MKAGEFFWTLLLGLWMGVMLCGAAEKLGDSYYNRTKALIDECQKSLPRDQNCKLVALPVDKN